MGGETSRFSDSHLDVQSADFTWDKLLDCPNQLYVAGFISSVIPWVVIALMLLACLVKKCRGNAAGASRGHAAEAPRSPLAKSTKQEEDAENQTSQACEPQASSVEATPALLKNPLPQATD